MATEATIRERERCHRNGGERLHSALLPTHHPHTAPSPSPTHLPTELNTMTVPTIEPTPDTTTPRVPFATHLTTDRARLPRGQHTGTRGPPQPYCGPGDPQQASAYAYSG